MRRCVFVCKTLGLYAFNHSPHILAGKKTKNLNFRIEYRPADLFCPLTFLKNNAFATLYYFDFAHYLHTSLDSSTSTFSQLVAARADRQVAAAAAEQLRAQIAELTAQREDAAARHDALIADQEQHYLGTFARVSRDAREELLATNNIAEIF